MMTLEQLLTTYMPSDKALRDISEFFAVFSQETRIKIIILLSVSELNVNDIAKIMHQNQSTISHQLRILKDRKIVNSTRKGKEIFYSVANSYVSEVLFSAVKATENNDAPLSEKISKAQNVEMQKFVEFA
ncbi:MAG: helix-turn-helix transcriptional regulator [Clostridia bacterium]|nr:helix-turn-helix transcriptional regulator [Clostridia bacterium]